MRLIGVRKFPEGWDEIEPMLIDFENKMRDAESEPTDGQRRNEITWKLTRINHQRSRYIFNLYKEKQISRQLYDFLIKHKLADPLLIAMWKKTGYENLCCVKCAQNSLHQHGGTCICRVPKKSLPKGKIVECVQCGCRGCASCDNAKSNKRDVVEEEERKRVPEEEEEYEEKRVNQEEEKEQEEEQQEEQEEEKQEKQEKQEEH